jgi:hypothetical protein
MKPVILLFVLSLGFAAAVQAQSRSYTNEDLGKPLTGARTPTGEEMQGVVARQFRLSPMYDGPKAFAVPYDPAWPFTYAQRLEPDPWRTPGGWPVYGVWPFYGAYYGVNPFHAPPAGLRAGRRYRSHSTPGADAFVIGTRRR